MGSIAVALTLAVLVIWLIVGLRSLAVTREVAQNAALVIGGIVSLAAILSVLVLFSIFLAREIVEVRRQQTFIDSVSHELKSPLASLRLCLETQRRSDLSVEQRNELAGMMADDIDRLSQFVDDVLETSRIRHVRRVLTLQRARVCSMLDSALAGLARHYGLQQGAVVVDVPADLEMHTDPAVLTTVLKNVLDNAIKYSRPPVAVSVRARAIGARQLEIEVRDRGIGIPRQHLRRVSQRFYRVPRPEVYAQRGTGLGLFLTASLVRDLGGKLRISSAGLDHGTAVRISLPRGGRAAAP